MTHRYEEAANWFIRMCKTNNWSHGLYTYIAGICYAELSHRSEGLISKGFANRASQLLEQVPGLIQRRRSFGGKRIPFEQFVEQKIASFRARAGTSSIVVGIAGPVTEEIIYLLCNGHKRMGAEELADSRKSLELWDRLESGEEEQLAMELMRSVVDRNDGRLVIARERLETTVIRNGLHRRISLQTNGWVAGFAYYEVEFYLELIYSRWRL